MASSFGLPLPFQSYRSLATDPQSKCSLTDTVSLAGPGGALQLPQLRQPEALRQEARPPQGGRGPAGKAAHAFLDAPFAKHAHTVMVGLPIAVLDMHTNTHTFFLHAMWGPEVFARTQSFRWLAGSLLAVDRGLTVLLERFLTVVMLSGQMYNTYSKCLEKDACFGFFNIGSCCSSKCSSHFIFK